ncbi:hypothetical protein LINGRAHAP2_LOCUS14439 [Linum grandiflorum]
MRQPQQKFFSPLQLVHLSSECCLRNMCCYQNHKKMCCSPVFIVLCSSSRFDQLNLLTWSELNLSPPIYGTLWRPSTDNNKRNLAFEQQICLRTMVFITFLRSFSVTCKTI